jgi:hypothetical protein
MILYDSGLEKFQPFFSDHQADRRQSQSETQRNEAATFAGFKFGPCGIPASPGVIGIGDTDLRGCNVLLRAPLNQGKNDGR